MKTGNAIKIFYAGGLKVTWAVPEKRIINFFGVITVFVTLSCIYILNHMTALLVMLITLFINILDS